MSKHGEFRYKHHGCHGGRHGGCGWRFGILILIFVMIGITMGGRNDVSFASAGPMRLHAYGAQSYMNGLRVESGQTLTGDVVVYSGDAAVETGGTIDGGLVVFSGDATVDSGGEVAGDLTVWAGDVMIDGRVGGNVAALKGDVELGDEAYVGGDVSTLSGEIDRSETATIAGNVVRSPKLGFGSRFFEHEPPFAPGAPAAPGAPPEPGNSYEYPSGHSLIGSFFGLVRRLFGALFMTLLATLVAMVVFTMRPTTIERVQKEMRGNLPRSFALGITVNVALWLVVTLLGISWCLLPLRLVPGLALLALVAVGLTALSRTVGQRLLPSLRSPDRRPVLEVALGAFLLVGALAVIAALFGGGSSTLLVLLALAVAAPGTGAFVEPWVDRYRNRSSQNYSTPGAPAASPAPTASPAAPSNVKVESVPVIVGPVEPAVVIAAETPVVSASEPEVDLSALESAAVRPSVDGDTLLGQPLSAVDASSGLSEGSAEKDLALDAEVTSAADEGKYVFELPETESAGTSEPSVEVRDLVQASDADVAAAAAAEAARATAARYAAGEPPAGDDFTRITGIGRSADRKLRVAGILTYAQLAAVPVEFVAVALGVRVEEVIEDEIQKQAHALAK